MDAAFIRRAEVMTSFNLTAHDFKTLDHKAEIQHLFQKHFFPTFDVSRTIPKVDREHLNDLIAELKRDDQVGLFPKLHTYSLQGVGPGEVSMFFLVKPAVIGGSTSAGIDIFVDSDEYEVKAATISKDRHAYGFKVGGAVPLADLMVEMNNLQNELGVGDNPVSISQRKIQEMRKLAPFGFRQLEEYYRDLTYEHYFRHHETIFINNTVGKNLGVVEAVKAVQKEDIFIERLTQGTVKPKVRL